MGFLDINGANSLANQTAGTVGGGNVFNAAPLFGASTIDDSGSTGADGASNGGVSAAATAAKGSPGATSVATPDDGGSSSVSFWAEYGSYILIAGGVGVASLLAYFVIKFFRRKK